MEKNDILLALLCGAVSISLFTNTVLASNNSFKGVCIRSIGTHSGNQTVAELINLTTGVSASFTIPASPTLPLTIAAALTLNTEEKLGLAWVSGGGAIVNLDLHLLS